MQEIDGVVKIFGQFVNRDQIKRVLEHGELNLK